MRGVCGRAAACCVLPFCSRLKGNEVVFPLEKPITGDCRAPAGGCTVGRFSWADQGESTSKLWAPAGLTRAYGCAEASCSATLLIPGN